MFNLQPTPPPPLHSLILRSILQHLGHGVANHSPYGLVGGNVPPVGPQPPVAGGTRPVPGPVQPPQAGPLPLPRPAPGPVQPPQASPYGVPGDPFGGGGYGPPRDLVHHIISGLL